MLGGCCCQCWMTTEITSGTPEAVANSLLSTHLLDCAMRHCTSLPSKAPTDAKWRGCAFTCGELPQRKSRGDFIIIQVSTGRDEMVCKQLFMRTAWRAHDGVYWLILKGLNPSSNKHAHTHTSTHTHTHKWYNNIFKYLTTYENFTSIIDPMKVECIALESSGDVFVESIALRIAPVSTHTHTHTHTHKGRRFSNESRRRSSQLDSHTHTHTHTHTHKFIWKPT
eukprot:GHVR01011869.1.p1 GENE.GHVR01011869.1~~GHVR01011869.1.p1  ORF type:complete len:224 (-),score=94.31 GHVR01011869.1:261-932(-)